MNKIIKVGLSAIGGMVAKDFSNITFRVIIKNCFPDVMNQFADIDTNTVQTDKQKEESKLKLQKENPVASSVILLCMVLEIAAFIGGSVATYKYLGRWEQKNTDKSKISYDKEKPVKYIVVKAKPAKHEVVKNKYDADKDFDHSFQQDQDEDQIAGEVEFVDSEFIAV